MHLRERQHIDMFNKVDKISSFLALQLFFCIFAKQISFPPSYYYLSNFVFAKEITENIFKLWISISKTDTKTSHQNRSALAKVNDS